MMHTKKVMKMPKFTVIKNYTYAEIYELEANSREDAVKIIDDSWDIDPLRVIQDFDFYDVIEQEKKNED